MTKLQTSLVAEETWVDGAAEKLSAALPNATSALELDVSICFHFHIFIFVVLFIFSKYIQRFWPNRYANILISSKY